MRVLLRIAYRNLREHQTKTLIIGSIIALGMLVLVVGNSVLDTATAGIETNYTENFTGDIIIAADGVETPGLTIDSAFTAEGATPTIPNYDETLDYLTSYEGVAAANPLILGFASAQIDGTGFGIVQLYGVDPDRYRSFFPENISLLEGAFLQPGQEGAIVLSTASVEMLEESAAREITVGDSILVTAQNQVTGTKIRELEVAGIFEFVADAQTLQLVSFISLTDVRILNGMTANTGADAIAAADFSSDEDSLFGASDSLFGGSTDSEGSSDDLFGSSDDVFGGGLVATVDTSAASARDFDSILGDTSQRDLLGQTDETAWNYILLRLDNPESAERMVAELNREFADNGMELVAFEWIDGAGTVAQLTNTLKIIFNWLIVVVAIVAVIIIMNTLVISVTERIPEIGTMRAIGAQRKFVRRMIVAETLMIAVVFGGVGILAGMGVTGILGATGIESSNEVLQIFMGGPVLSPVVSGASVFQSLIAVILVGIFASLYPASIALGIQPVTAMNQN